MSENVMTPEFRVSYPNLLEPRLNDLNGKMEYSVVALFKKGEDLSKLKVMAENAVVEKWGADKTKWPKTLRSPFRDQGERESDGYEEGAVFINLKSNQRPGVVDANVQTIIDPSQVYPGCYGRATVRAYAYAQKGNRDEARKNEILFSTWGVEDLGRVEQTWRKNGGRLIKFSSTDAKRYLSITTGATAPIVAANPQIKADYEALLAAARKTRK